MNTNDLAELYLQSIESRGVRDVTLLKYQWELRHFLRDFGHHEIQCISLAELVIWLRNIRQSDGSRYAHGSLAGISKGIRYFFKFAEKRGYIETNVADDLPRYSQKPVKRQAAPEADVIAILNSMDAFINQRGRALCDLRDGLIVSFAISTGARLRTITELEKKAVVQALESPIAIYGPEGLAHVYHLFAEGKGDKILELRFSQSTAQLFIEYLQRTQHVARSSPNIFVANRQPFGPVSQYTVNSAFKRICHFAGVKTRLSHSIRKANVTAILDNGGDIKTAAGYAQHSDISITLQHYVYGTPRRIDIAAASMDQRRQAEAQVMREMETFFKKSR